ncbi:hypothetical protein HZ326_17196 [Fusarium oxysporum f. sp. albedinis]|nr:hypothetical protein HZ326_17196 [Fusarium oxysporum f. sp. albedinis]
MHFHPHTHPVLPKSLLVFVGSSGAIMLLTGIPTHRCHITSLPQPHDLKNGPLPVREEPGRPKQAVSVHRDISPLALFL